MLLIDALKVAEYGNWHVMYYTVTIPLLAICCAHIYLNVTIAYIPLHRCRTPPGAIWTDLVRVTDVTADKKSIYSSCDMYTFHIEDGVYKPNDTFQSCSNEFEYMEDASDYTLTEDAKPMSPRFGPTLSQTLNVTCNNVFATAFPGLSSIAIWPFQPFSLPFMDKLGRKSVLCVTLSLSGIILAITPYVDTYWNMWVIRCLQRIFIQIAYLALTRHIVELHPIDERHCTVALIVAGYASGLPFLVLLDWFFNSHWRKVVHALALCTLIWTPVVILFLPESPLFWVVNVNREKEADSVVRRIARWNGVKLPLDFCVEPSPLLTNSLTRMPPRWQGYLIRSWKKIMYNPFIFRRWLYATLTWFVVNYIWVSVSITRAVHPFSLRWNFAIIGFMAMLGGILTQFLLRVFKKMEIIVTFLFLASIGFLVDAYVMPTDGLGLSQMTMKYIIRSVFYCLTAVTTLSMLSIIRLQSAEIRGEECQPGAIFWMILFATTGGALGMYYVKLVSMAPMYTPLLSGLATVLMAFSILIWLYDIDFMEDCRWRSRMKESFCGKRRPILPRIRRHILLPLHIRHEKTDLLHPAHRLSITSSAGT